MSNINYTYDKIILSEEKLKYLANNAKNRLQDLKSIVNDTVPGIQDSISAASDLLTVNSYFYVSILSCLVAMGSDWDSLYQAIVKKVELEEFITESIKDSDPVKGIQVVGQVRSGLYYNLADFVSEHLGHLNRKTNASFSGIVTEHEFIKISGWDFSEIEQRNKSVSELIRGLEDYYEAVKAFVDSSMFQGDFANAVKDYLKTAHLLIVEKFSDMAHAMRKLGQDYRSSYESYYGGLGFKIDEEELEAFKRKIMSSCDVISQKIYSGNKLIGIINDAGEGELRLATYPHESFSYADQFVFACTSELQAVRKIEDETASKLNVFINDVDNFYVFSRNLKKHSGFNILTADLGTLRGLGSNISTKYVPSAVEFIDDIEFCKNGKVDPLKRDRFIEIIKKDPAYADRLDVINAASADDISGMLKYYAMREEFQTHGSVELDLNRALDMLEINGSWFGKLYRAGNGTNGYLSSASNYVYSAEHKPDDVIERAITWAKKIAADDEHHGYPLGNSFYSRWGEDYDCSSFVVSAYELGGKLDIINGRGNDIRTASMVDRLTNCGFVAIPIGDDFTIDQLREGDIIMRDVGENGHGSHAEIYTDGGRTIHATFMSYDNTAVGDQTLQSIEETEGYDLQRYLDEFKNNKFGTSYTPDNYVNEDGLSVVGEICGHMVAAPGSNTFTYEPREAHWQYVIRYTGGA